MKLFINVLIVLLLTACEYKKQDFQNSATSQITIAAIQEPIPTNTSSTLDKTSTSFKNTPCKVTKIVDGDSIEIELLNSKKEKVRLLGIDSSELYSPNNTSIECFAKESYQKANSTLAEKQIYLEADPSQSDRDDYNRLLRYVFLEDGTNFNLLMIAEGFAREYTFKTPYKYQQEFKEAEKSAKSAKKGLWGENACYQPTQISLSFTCGNKTKCSQMQNCEEAKYYLKNCGLSRIDRDRDGIPCEIICK